MNSIKIILEKWDNSVEFCNEFCTNSATTVTNLTYLYYLNVEGSRCLGIGMVLLLVSFVYLLK